MRKLSVLIMLIFVIGLSACGSDGTINNFEIRKDDYYISDDDRVIIDYKTNEDGKLVEISIDRLMTVQDMFYYNNQIDYEYIPEGFSGNTFTEAGYQCNDYENLFVPVNLEIGNTKFKYDRFQCEYREVDRDNEFKTGTYIRKYNLRETIDVARDVIVTIVIFDDTSIERFIEIQDIPHTMKMLGVYTIGLNIDQDGYSEGVFNYYRDMAVYEQLLLKHQENEAAMDEVLGVSESVNLLELDLLAEVTPLVKDFEERYALEIAAIEELVGEISVIADDVVPTDNDEEPITDPGTGDTA